MLILLTGLRREKAARLAWKDIDFKAKTLTILETKNSITHIVPLSDYLYDLLQRRKESAINGYVFPANSATGYLNDPRKVLMDIKPAKVVYLNLKYTSSET